MPSLYELAVAFTDGLLALISQPPLTFELGANKVNVSTGPVLNSRVSLEDAGDGLKTMECSVSLPNIRGLVRTVMYISAGPRATHLAENTGFPEGPHYLYVHDRDGHKALQVPMQQVVSADGEILLSVEIKLPKDGPAAEERVCAWLRTQGHRFDGDRVILGTAADYQSLLVNLLTVALIKQHVRGYFVIPSLVDELPPRGMDDEPQEVEVTFRDYKDQRGFEANAANSGRLPPLQVRFQVEVGDGRNVTMWASRFGANTKCLNTCEGAYNGMAELLRESRGVPATV